MTYQPQQLSSALPTPPVVHTEQELEQMFRAFGLEKPEERDRLAQLQYLGKESAGGFIIKASTSSDDTVVQDSADAKLA